MIIGHKNELLLITRLFQDNFPGETIKIFMSYKDDLYPVKLKITFSDRYDVETSETYKKQILLGHENIYNDEVWCSLHKNKIHYEKIQTFKQETPWLLT
jgi:hypothetical protein